MAFWKIVGLEVTPRMPAFTWRSSSPDVRSWRFRLSSRGLWPKRSYSSWSFVMTAVLLVLGLGVRVPRPRPPYPGSAGDRSHRRLAAEQRDRGREAVEEVAAADRTELAGSEETGDLRAVERLGEDAGVVVGLVEEVPAPPVAREQQGGVRLPSGEEQAEVLVGGGAVAHLELDGGADLDQRVDGDGPVGPVRPQHVPDEEVAAVVLGDLLVDHQAQVEALVDELDLVLGEAAGEMLEPVQRRLAAQLVDHVALGFRHDERVADRAAPLGHD